MKSSAFIKIIAKAYRVEEQTVGLYTRFMKEAGLITSGARGVNAPHMHPRDAVRLTIALLATGTAAHAAPLYRRFAGMEVQPFASKDQLVPNSGISEGATLEAVLLHMFSADMFPEGIPGGGPMDCNPYLELQEGQRIATIKYSTLVNGKLAHDEKNRATAFFMTRDRPRDMAAQDRQAHGGIFVSRGLATMSLSECAIPFYLEWRDKVSWETMEKETADEKEQRFRHGNFTLAKGLWFDRDLGEGV